MDQKEFYSLLKRVPKAEIHLHIEAVPTIETIKALYKKRFDKEMTDEDITNLFSYEDLNGFIQAFVKIQDLFTCEDDLNYVFDDLEEYLLENNIVYTEAFFAPTAFLKKGFEYPKMTAIFSKKIAQIKKKHGIVIKLLMDVSRTFGCENAMKNYNLLKEYPCKDVIGIGLGGAEIKGPAAEYAPVFEQAIKDGIHAVAHAGEDVGPESMWDTINLLHAERIGHGITAYQDEKLMEELKKSQLPLEVCPTSNVFTKHYVKSISEHPIRTFFDKGIFVTVNTDDPVFFKTTLIEEFWKLHSEANFSIEEIKTLVKNAFNALFISAKKKKEWCQKVDEAFNA
ncbi:MAG: adenosine deaminase [Treponema sp.]|nr:adenosine deaminase [Treponema sp.]